MSEIKKTIKNSDYASASKMAEHDKYEQYYIDNCGGLTYKKISELLSPNLVSENFIKEVAETSRPEYLPSLYFKRKVSDEYISIRLGNHSPNLKSYYTHINNMRLSKNEDAHLIFLFYGVYEESKPLSRKISISKDGVRVTVKKTELDTLYPINIHFIHYRPGCFDISNLNILENSIKNWSINNGDVEFLNPFKTNEHITEREFTAYITVELKGVAEQLITVRPGTAPFSKIKLEEIDVLNEDGTLYATADVVLYIDKMYYNIDTSRKSKQEDIMTNYYNYLRKVWKI